MDTGTPVTQIGKYQILGILGVGGMGVVYRGMDNSVGREVAIKTLTEATEELRQRFQLEARSGVLNHPNIVTVYDFGEQDGNPYIVMEFVPGDSLENLLRAGRQFSLIEKLEIVRQVCLGLGYAHQKGVIHRDIKPANVMVQPDGNIKIVDFGVARPGKPLRSHTGGHGHRHLSLHLAGETPGQDRGRQSRYLVRGRHSLPAAYRAVAISGRRSSHPSQGNPRTA